MKKILLGAWAALCCMGLLTGAPSAAGAAYPEKPITIIIPFGPGGAVDIASRIMAEFMQNKHNITLNVVCKGGGGGAPAMLDVAKARPDGYTFGFPSMATFSTTPQVKNTGYTIKDFKAVAQVTNMWLSLAVRSDSNIKSFKELMEAAEKNPGKVNFATHGVLSLQRLFMNDMLKKYPGVQLPHVAYGSGHEVSTALLGNHITSAFGVFTNQKPYAQSGDFIIIGVGADKRLPDFPDIPTFAEQLGPEFVSASVHGLLAPKNTPNERIIVMQDLVKEALADPEVKAKFAKAGLSTDYLPADEFQKAIDAIWTHVGIMLKEVNAK